MDRCTEFQSQMLDYVYDLLDEGVAVVLGAHLDQCAVCQSALREAQAQQQLFASAARLEFPAVRFVVPEERRAEPAAALEDRRVYPGGSPEKHRVEPVDAPAVLSLPRAPARPLWRRWAAVAAALMALAVPGWLANDYAAARRTLDDRAAVAADRRLELDALDNKLAALDSTRQEELERRERQVREQEVHLVVSGAKNATAGAFNHYRVDAYTWTGQPARARIESVSVLDDKENVVYKENVVSKKKELGGPGTYQVTLPPDLPLVPGRGYRLKVVAAGERAQAEVSQEFQITPPVYLAHLATDKPMYQPGETVRFRSVALERFSLEPARERLAVSYTLTAPNGEAVDVPPASFYRANEEELQRWFVSLGPSAGALRGVSAGEWDLPPNAPGGEYTLTVHEGKERFPSQERRFTVVRHVRSRMNKKLDFTRKSYGPGDEVVASCSVTGPDGRPVARRLVLATVTIDGATYGADGNPSDQPLRLNTDEAGKVLVRFRLPGRIEQGQASLNVVFHDGSGPEPWTKPIPVVLNRLEVDFFPEGGYLVRGVPNRVYFRVRTPQGRPAELKGRLVDDLGDEVARLQTLHDDHEPGVNQGMGVFQFTPWRDRSYELKIDRPHGIEGKHVLPTEKFGRVLLSVPAGVTTPHEPITAQVRSVGEDRTLLIGAYCRGRLFDHQRVLARDGEDVAVQLTPAHGAGGVFRITVFEEQRSANTRPLLVPQAERLVYRHHRDRLNLAFKAERDRYVPGDTVKATLTARGENQELTPAVIGIGVVDQAVRALADEKTARTMPTHILLGTEVENPEDLEYADFLLTPHPKAAPALDLLLGTQGWRRFAERSPEEMGEEQRKQLAAGMVTPAAGRFDMAFDEIPRVTRAWAAAAEEASLESRLGDARVAVVESFRQREAELRAEQAEARRAYEAAVAEPAYRAARDRVEAYNVWINVLAGVFPLLAVVLVIGGAVLLGRALTRPLGRALPPLCGAAACLALLVLTALVARHQPAPRDEPTRQAAVAQNAKVEDKAPPRGNGPADDAEDLKAPAVDGTGHPDKGTERWSEDKGDKAERAVPVAPMPQPAREPSASDTGKGKSEPVPPPAPKAPAPDAPSIATDDAKPTAPSLGKAGVTALPQPGATDPGSSTWTPPAPGFGGSGGFSGRAKGAVPSGPPYGFMGGGIGGGPPGGMGIGGFGGGFGGGNMPAARFSGHAPDRKKAEGKNVQGGDQADHLPQVYRPLDGKSDKGGGADFGYLRGDDLRKYYNRATEQEGKTWADQNRDHDGDRWNNVRRRQRGWGADKDKQGKDIPRAAGKEGVDPAVFFVREYAHERPAERAARRDFTETVYWHPALVLPDGRVEVSFQLSDAVTNYQLLMFGHTLDGRLAAATGTIQAGLPFTLTPSVPPQVTFGDKVDVPLAVTNTTGLVREITLEAAGDGLKTAEGWAAQKLTLQAEDQGRRLFRFEPQSRSGAATLEFRGRVATFEDRVQKRIEVAPEGFPVEEAASDLLEGTARHTLELPPGWVPGTLKLNVQAFPSALADLQRGLEGLLREPHGCFEQASASNYPNLLILDYLRESGQVKPEVEKKARDLLDRGYETLLSFECVDPQKRRAGYEWFGGTVPPNEALTAYGLMQFRELARAREVDGEMLERTKKFLLSRRDGRGGFERKQTALGAFSAAPEPVANAYIVWALTESGPEDVSAELTALAGQASTSQDPYFVSLVSASLVNRGRTVDAVRLLKGVAKQQQADGHLDAAQTSITGSSGKDLQVETTALAVLAWLKADAGGFGPEARKAVRWLGRQRDAGGAFGGTQATVLALKALIAYTKAHPRPREDGELKLYVGSLLVATRPFKAASGEALTLELPEAETKLRPGKNVVRVEVTGRNIFPYTLAWSYQTRQPPSDPACPVKLETRLSKTRANEGEAVRLTVKLTNLRQGSQGMTVAVVGLPGGLALPEDLKQLKQHREAKGRRPLVSAFELRGRELVLYWRGLEPGQEVEVPIDLSCRVPGEYSGPASRAYLYYNADAKTWVPPLKVAITPKAE